LPNWADENDVDASSAQLGSGCGAFYKYVEIIAMSHSTRIALVIFFAWLIAGCSPEPSQLEILAHQLE
jgi:hypothetical protein